MNKKSLTYAIIIGIAAGILIFHPLWVSLHAFDGLHEDDSSWLGFVILAYKKAFTFEHLLHVVLSVFTGILVAILVLMMKVRNKHKNNRS
jgi:predicted small secreted protein